MGKITGKGSYAFYGLETTWKSNTSTGVRQAFNPMEKLPVPKTPPKTTLVRTFDSRNPTIAFTTHIEPGEITYEGNYKDPFLMMSFFTAKYITGVEAGTPASAWSTGTEGTGLISGSFETDDNESTIYMQVHGDDRAGASDIDKRFHGGLVGNYIWKIAKQSLLKESAEVLKTEKKDKYMGVSYISNPVRLKSWEVKVENTMQIVFGANSPPI